MSKIDKAMAKINKALARVNITLATSQKRFGKRVAIILKENTIIVMII